MNGVVDDPTYWTELDYAWKQLNAAYERAKALRIYDLEGNEVQPALKQFVIDARRATVQISIECEKDEIRRAQVVAVESTARIDTYVDELSKL